MRPRFVALLTLFMFGTLACLLVGADVRRRK